MGIAIVTGAAGLVGAHSVEQFHALGLDIFGLDNDMRRFFFPGITSSDGTRARLESLARYRHFDHDIRDEAALNALFEVYGQDIAVVVHAAAQPSHDWAAEQPLTDFSVNAMGTLLLLEATRRHCPEAAFIFCSTNKVYGSRPNELPLIGLERRWDLNESHPYFPHGIPEQMSIDGTKHSLFGVSKAAADLMVQEYGLYFGMRTGVFRAGCITGASHRGAVQHGFLAYLASCVATGRRYEVIGHDGKQVRDNIHAADVARAFVAFFQSPRSGEVYNIGGGRPRSCSVIEAIDLFEEAFGKKLDREYVPQSRPGDHIWWISDMGRFQKHYPSWTPRFSLKSIVDEFAEELRG
ncbi:NAD-dependent epimerase/dehydratase family protein [Bosea sp. TND4EK4]|uniref:NAD-dependent epimerase/dehydratase family protein n=1 Tax=Bosea sp. TND4EK4 TaxID=1907408 RepID=UPI000956FCD0|nr:NAD-dependent epimerase/dehydratase family protein [Bosea sp. TND4EK4]SIR60870.1 CDP-paratose 2-epimerase [Bosea sp. TND4EK4]